MRPTSDSIHDDKFAQDRDAARCRTCWLTRVLLWEYRIRQRPTSRYGTRWRYYQSLLSRHTGPTERHNQMKIYVVYSRNEDDTYIDGVFSDEKQANQLNMAMCKADNWHSFGHHVIPLDLDSIPNAKTATLYTAAMSKLRGQIHETSQIVVVHDNFIQPESSGDYNVGPTSQEAWVAGFSLASPQEARLRAAQERDRWIRGNI